MKTFKYLTGFVLLSGMLALTSCDDFLDKEQENTVPVEDIDYTDMSTLHQPVNGLYDKYRSGLTHWVLQIQHVIRDGDYWSGRINDQTALLTWRQYDYANNYFGINEAWTQYYGAIKIANTAEEALNEYAKNITDDATRAKYRSYVGEVKILRALCYYRLVQFFGPVTILHSNLQPDMRRSSVELVYKYLLDELQYAIENCEKLRPNEMEFKGSVTAYTAELLAAKIHLQMGNYEKVRELTDDIINSGKFKLYDDYYQLFKKPGRLCDESLFEIQCSDLTTTAYGTNSWFAAQGPLVGTPAVAGRELTGWGFVGAYESFRDWAVKRGETVRRETSFLEGGRKQLSGDSIGLSTNAEQATIWNGKAYTPTTQATTEGRTSYGSGNNVRVLRYADAILMNAEANLRLGNQSEALKKVNQIRKRAQMPDFTSVTIDDILDERRMEFCAEWGDRYDDILRTGQAPALLGPKGWDESKRYLPLPFSQISNYKQLLEEPYQ
ncbi:MAG: RagB/SusD family nutrient uptake outer membrane protein [Prevotella sp.]|nr:RagB/SusD family nutrient uptake outer membrane protein [Prevotella sp.]